MDYDTRDTDRQRTNVIRRRLRRREENLRADISARFHLAYRAVYMRSNEPRCTLRDWFFSAPSIIEMKTAARSRIKIEIQYADVSFEHRNSICWRGKRVRRNAKIQVINVNRQFYKFNRPRRNFPPGFRWQSNHELRVYIYEDSVENKFRASQSKCFRYLQFRPSYLIRETLDRSLNRRLMITTALCTSKSSPTEIRQMGRKRSEPHTRRSYLSSEDYA